MQLARRTLAVLFVLLVTVTATATVAGATHSTVYGHNFGRPDSNGYVPEYYPWTLPGGCYDGTLATTHYYVDRSAWYGPHVMWIEYDRCEMRRIGASAGCWANLKAHERAHSRGFAHHEGSPSYNAAYHPNVPLC